jgi:hypothetical protein
MRTSATAFCFTLMASLVSGSWILAQKETDIQIQISLQKGSEKGQFVVVEGRVKGIPDGTLIAHAVWPDGDIFYTCRPGAVTRVRNQKFEFRAQVGRAGNIDEGKFFTIYAFALAGDSFPTVDERTNRAASEGEFAKIIRPYLYQKSPHALSAGLRVKRQ